MLLILVLATTGIDEGVVARDAEAAEGDSDLASA